jgi:hypothetical protein
VDGAGEVAQPLVFDRPVGGRTFTLSLKVQATADVTLDGIRVVGKSGVVLLRESPPLTGDDLPDGFVAISATATWPAGLADTEATLMLVGSGDATVHYDQIRFAEGPLPDTRADADVVRFEHDLALFKPRTDIVLLGAPTPPPLQNAVGTLTQPWTMEVSLGAGTMVGQFTDGRLVSFNNAPIQPGTPNEIGLGFGWQERGEDPRKPLAGLEQSLLDFDPDAAPLPTDFSNRYFNGGLYVGNAPVFAHPDPAGSTVTIKSTATYVIGGGEPDKTEAPPAQELTLPGAPIAEITFRTADAPDAPTETQQLPMKLDTVVINQPDNWFSAVWRGNWDFASVPEDRYVRLAIS